jgi:hypothetical protein
MSRAGQRMHHQITGEPMKFITLADWTGIVERNCSRKPTRVMGWQRFVIPCWKSPQPLNHLKMAVALH